MNALIDWIAPEIEKLKPGVESFLIGLVIAAAGSIITLYQSGQPLTAETISLALAGAFLNYLTSKVRLAQSSPPDAPEPPVVLPTGMDDPDNEANVND